MIPTYADYFDLLVAGRVSAPRGLATHGRDNQEIMFTPGEMIGRLGINWRLGVMEGLQLIAGIFDKGKIAAVAPRANLDLFTDQSAYGPRLADQIPLAIDALKLDPETRRATMILPRYGEVGSADMPCTTTIGFSIMEPTVMTTVTMRSSDAVWGLPYDITQFGMLSMAVAYVLGRAAGLSTMFITNAHVYEKTMHLKPASRGRSISLSLAAAGVEATWPAVRAWANAAVVGFPWLGEFPKGVMAYD